MTTQHTPGPWTIDAAPNGYTYIRAEHRAEIALVGSENMLADDSSAASNARLIAAAPDMLEALKVCESVLRIQGYVNAADIARAAITRATA